MFFFNIVFCDFSNTTNLGEDHQNLPVFSFPHYQGQI